MEGGCPVEALTLCGSGPSPGVMANVAGSGLAPASACPVVQRARSAVLA
jgi:hypothetical protein